jgi:hypothetical protein
VPLFYFFLVFLLELKKIVAICFVLAIADGILLTLISVFLQAIGKPGSTDLLKYGLGTIVQILGIVGLVAFCVFVLSAFGIAVQKFPGRDDDLV